MIELKKFGITVTINKADWVCEYCSEPLGKQAVTTLGGGYAHRECDPLFIQIDREAAAEIDRLRLALTEAQRR